MPTAQERLAAASERAVPVQVGLIDDAVVVGAAPFDVEESVADVGPWLRRPIVAREAVVLERLPATARRGGRPGARPEPPNRVEWFCFPEGEVVLKWRRERPPSRCHAFALHAEGPPVRGVVLVAWRACGRWVPDGGRWAPRAPEARQRGGARSRRLWAPVALCLLTRLGVVPALVAWLEQAEPWLAARWAGGGGGDGPSLVARLAQLADEAPRPVRGALSLLAAGPLGHLVDARERVGAPSARAARPAAVAGGGALPRPVGGGGSLWLAALLLGPEGLATALACVLLERPLCLHAESTTVLAPVAEALLALAAPLEWAGVYVPVLPKPLLELLDAPQAFLLGVESKWIDRGFYAERRRAEAAAGARDRERRAARGEEPVSAEDLRLPGAAAGPDVTIGPGVVLFDLDARAVDAPGGEDPPALPPAPRDAVVAAARALREQACLAAHGDGDGDAAADGAARAPHVGLQAAEARLQLACAAAVLDLLDPGHDRAAAATPARRGLEPKTRGVIAVARCAPAARPFTRALVETQHFQQLFEGPGDRLGAARAATDAAAAAAAAEGAADADVVAAVHGPRDDRFAYRLPPPLDPDDDDDGAPPADAPPPPAPAADAPPDAAADAAAPPRLAWRPPRLLDHVGAPAPPPTRVYRYGTLADLLGVSLAELRAALEPPEPPPTNGGTSPRSFARDADADEASTSEEDSVR